MARAGDAVAAATAAVSQERRGWKRWGFLTATSLGNGAIAFISVALARLMMDHLMPTGAYLWLCLAASSVVVVMSLASRPDRQRAPGGILEEWIEASREAVAAGMALVLITFLWRPEPIQHFSFSRGTVLATVPVLFVLVGLSRTAWRLLLLHLRRQGHNLASIVVIGDSSSSEAFIKTIGARSGTGYRVVGRIDSPDVDADLAWLLSDLSRSVHIDEVVIASFEVSTEQMEALIAEPAMAGVRVRAVPEIFGLPPSKVEIGSFAGFPVLTLFENPVRGIRWKLKRAVDLTVASTALVLLSPLLGAIALAISLTTRGPILFKQERVGMDGKRFTMLKFRSMVANAPDAHHRELMSSFLTAETEATAPHPSGFFKAADDPRITALGRVLRRFSLDELPQLFNVLRGEMSLVGPRPALSYEVALYKKWQRRRLHVLPGVTGLWQVSGRSRLSPADMLRLDVHYAETWSLTTDIKIILRTIPAILRDDAR